MTGTTVRSLRERQPTDRRGTAYFVVLVFSLIIVVTGVSAIRLSRVAHASAMHGRDRFEARRLAMSAIDVGLLMIKQDSLWRTKMDGGVVPFDEPLGRGTLTLLAVDRVDGQITLGNDPVELTGIGRVGQIVFKMRVDADPNASVQTGSWRRVVD